MRYDETYVEDVRSSISSAINKLATCIADASNIPSIPSDFEKNGDVNNVKTGISNIKLDDISSEIEGVIKSYGVNNTTKGENLLDILNIGKKWGEMLKDLNTKTATSQKVANIQLKREQDRIDKETKEVQERTQASLKNAGVAFKIGTRKMGENIQDFMITRKAELQAEHIRQIYGASKQSKKMYGEKAEEEAKRIEEEAMIKTEKNKTQEYADKLYEENPELQEIDDRAYAPFKRTGTGYKIVEGTPVVASSAVIMAVAPEAAPVIIPVMVGVNSAGQATEEYLHDKKSNSKEGITQSYKNGEISKEEYDNYEYIWNLTDEEVEKYAKNNNLTKEEVEAINKIRNMNEEWTTEENLTDANLYGNAVGIVDGLMSAGGMQLYRFNPFGNDLLNRGTRVLIDTASAAADAPIKATIRSVIDDDKDFKTAFEDMGGMQAVVTSAIIGFGGSLLGEVIDASKSKKTEVDNDSNVSRTRAEIDNDSNVSRTRAEIDNDSNVSRTRTEIDDDRYVLKNRAEIDNDSNISGTRAGINNDSNTTINDKIKIAQEKADEYLREKGILWMKKGKNQLENVVVCHTDEEFKKYLIKYNGSEDWIAFKSWDGNVFIRPDSDIVTIIHEGNHVIGLVYPEDITVLQKFRIADWQIMRGIDEAFTESIALRMEEIEVIGTSGYNYNVKLLNEYIDLLNAHGYADIDLFTYFGRDKALFGEVLNEIMGDKYFYYNLANNMDYADGCSYRTTNESIEMDVQNSRRLLEDQLERFKAKISQTDNGSNVSRTRGKIDNDGNINPEQTYKLKNLDDTRYDFDDTIEEPTRKLDDSDRTIDEPTRKLDDSDRTIDYHNRKIDDTDRTIDDFNEKLNNWEQRMRKKLIDQRIDEIESKYKNPAHHVREIEEDLRVMLGEYPKDELIDTATEGTKLKITNNMTKEEILSLRISSELKRILGER